MSDGASALPASSTLTATGAFPIGLIDSHHMMVLGDDVLIDEVELLASSLDPEAGWIAPSQLQVCAGAYLQGPWPVDEATAQVASLPSWVTHAFFVHVPMERTSALPQSLRGCDPLSDAFDADQPTGRELLTLLRCVAMARRLGGGVRIAPSGALITPDPGRHVSLLVASPVWLSPDAVAHLVASVSPCHIADLVSSSPPPAPGEGFDALDEMEQRRLVETVGADVMERAWREARSQSSIPRADVRDSHAVVVPIPGFSGNVTIITREVEVLPYSISGVPWAQEGMVEYEIRWMPEDRAYAFMDYPPESILRERRAAGDLIDQIARRIADAAGGIAIDDDTFVVDVSAL